MESDELYERYQALQRYVGWEAADAERVRAAGTLLAPCFADLIDDFYGEIERHPDARRVITGGAQQIERLKQTLRTWLGELFVGTYDADYVLRRWKVGLRHVQIGLRQVYTNAAMSRLRGGLLRFHEQIAQGPVEELLKTRGSLNKLIDLDLAIIEDAYQTEYLASQQRAERLAVVGQVSAGIAHEIRNPLNVIKTSIYYLRNAKNAAPEKVDSHLERIERQALLADKVITALHDFARLPLPRLQAVPAWELLQQAISAATLPPTIDLKVECAADIPALRADADQLRIVLDNLIRNACEAMSGSGRLTLAAMTQVNCAAISVTDTGVGMNAGELATLKEPFRSSKARGLGLGLAISRAIVDKHAGRLEVSSQPGEGSVFTVLIPFFDAAFEGLQ